MTTPQGWYDDGSGRQRWWDGTAWTEHFAPAAAAASAPAPGVGEPAVTPTAAPPAPGGGNKRLWIILGAVAAGAVLLIVVAIVLVTTLLGNAVAAPVQSVQTYNDGWNPIDCSKIEASVTQDYYEEELGSCDGFTELAENFNETTPGDYDVTVTSSTVVGNTATIVTNEKYEFEGEPQVDVVTYTLVNEGGRWLISAIEYPES